MRIIKHYLIVFLISFVGTTTLAINNYPYFNYTTKNGLPTNQINTYAIDKNGIYWFGTEAGLVRWSNNFELYTIADGLISNHINALTFDLQNRLIIGTGGKGICMYDGISFTPLKFKNHQTINSLYHSKNENLLIIEDSQSLHAIKDNKTIKTYKKSDFIGSARYMEADSLIFLTYPKGDIKCYNKKENIFSDERYNNQFSQISKPHYSTLHKEEIASLINLNQNNASFFDYNSTDKTYIFGTKNNGIYIVPHPYFKHIKLPDINHISAIIPTNTGAQIIGDNIYSFDINDHSWIKTIKPYNQLNTISQQIYYTPNKYLHTLFSKKTGNNKAQYILSDSCKSININDSIIFCHYNNTISLYDLDDLKLINSVPFSYTIKKSYNYHDKYLFLTLNNGLFIYDTKSKIIRNINEKITHISTSIDEAIIDNYDRLIIIDSDGRIDILTNTNNKLVVQNSISPPNSITNERVKWSLIDQENNIWIGANKSLHRLVIDNSNYNTDIKSWGNAEGYNANNAQSAIEVKDQILIIDQKSIITFSPHEIEAINRTPLINLKKISHKGIDINWTYSDRDELSERIESNKLELNYSKSLIAFEFESSNTIGKDRILYRSRLIPNTKGWSAFSTNPNIYLNNIKPGNYTLKVQAYYKNFPSDVQSIEYNFSINSPWYNNVFTRIVYVVLSIVFIVLIVNYRFKQVKLKDESKLMLRERMALIKMEALQMHMNPHFIFNAMNSLQSSVLENDTEKSLEFIGEFSSLIRTTLENASKQLISFKEELSYIENYLRVEQIRYGKNIEYSINISDNVELNKLLIPPMLIQPHIENAIKYSIPEDISYIIISISRFHNQVSCMIEDNGMGRSLSSKMKKQHQSKGQKITNERIQLLNFYYKKEDQFKFEIEDLYDENNNPSGTRVTIFFPAMIIETHNTQ